MKSELPTAIQPENTVYQGEIIEVVTQLMQERGRTKHYEFARRAPGIRLIVVSPDKQILITREYRPELGSWDYRLPGGKMFDTLREYKQHLTLGSNLVVSGAAAAQREAEQEAGIQVSHIRYFATSPCGATMRWDLFYYVVDRFAILSSQTLGEGENITTNWYSIDQAREICLTGQMSEDRSAAVLLRYLHQTKLV